MSIVETFRTYDSRRQTLVIAAGVVVIAAVLVAVYFAFVRVKYDVLFSNLRTLDAASIVAELDKKKVPYRLRDSGATILVPAKLVDSTRLSVMTEDLPLKGAVGFELFNKSDMGLTEFAQKINYRRALQGELARTITSIDAIDSARVHLSIAEPTIFKDDRQPSKASVTVLTRPGKSLSADTVIGIQRLVAAAVPDLGLGDVVVLDHRGVVVSVAGALSPSAPETGEPTADERHVSAQYEGLVLAALQALPVERRYEVSVTTAPLVRAPEGVDAEATLGPRNVQLMVAILTPPGLTEFEKDQIRRVAAKAIDFDEVKGDQITLASSEILLQPRAPVVADAKVTEVTPHASPGGLNDRLLSPRAYVFTLAIPTLVALLAVAFALRRRKAAPRRLTDEQREDYAARLRSILEREDVNVRQGA